MTDEQVVRPADENRKVADYYLEKAGPNTAMEGGGIRLGEIASHIETQYYVLKARKANGEKLTADEDRRLIKFEVFVTKKIPSIAAQAAQGVGEDLRDSFKHTPVVNYPVPPTPASPVAEALRKQLEQK